MRQIKWITIVAYLLASLILSGCVHQQYASEPYPAWGEEKRILQSGNNPSVILRAIQPQVAEQTKACLLLVHGMNEHIGRYGDVARHFAQQNYIVAGLDFYAHGLSNPVLQQANQILRSGTTQVDISEAYQAQAALSDLEPLRFGFGRALDELVNLCDENNNTRVPVFIVAHSLGSLVTATYLMQNRNMNDAAKRVEGVVFLGPGFAVSEVPGWRGWIANPIIKLSFYAESHFLNPHDEPLPIMLFNQAAAFLIVPIIDGLFEMLSWPGLRHLFTPPTPGWVVDYLTDSEVEKQRIRNDNWIIRRTLLRYAKGIEAEIVRFRSEMNAFDVPYLLVFSAHDPITPAWGSEDFINATLKNHTDNEQLELSDSRYHQHLFLTEPRRSEILDHVDQWLNKRMHVCKQREEKCSD